MRLLSRLFAIFVAVSGLSAVAQIGSSAGEVSGGVSSFSAPLPVFGEGSQRDQPYTLTQKTTTVRTLADGTHITTVRDETRIRDAEGRVRTEIINETGRPVEVTLVSIVDPVAHTWTTLNQRDKIAYVNQLPAPAPLTPEQQAVMAEARAKAEAARAAEASSTAVGGSTAVGASTASKPHRDAESLPPRTIAGVAAEGRLVTRTIPAGTQGNDRDLITTTETWNSPELHVLLERVTDDPRLGKSTMTTTSLERVSPDPGLFQIPPDYKVAQQSKSF